jgi:hypothetical protein
MTIEEIRAIVRDGRHCRVTLRSERTGLVVVWKIRKANGKKSGFATHWCSVKVDGGKVVTGDLVDAVVEHWEYRGIIARGERFERGWDVAREDRVSDDALNYFWKWVICGGVMPGGLVVDVRAGK